MKPTEFLNELSNDTLASYKKKAGADATAADKAGDTKKADKRFSGIVKATKKEFDNDEKKEVAEAGNNYHANRTGFSRPSNHRDDERHDLDTPTQVWGLKINGKVWSKGGKDVTFTSKEAALNIRNSILKNRPDLEIGLITKGGSTASGAQSKTDDNFRNFLAQRKVGEEQLDEIIDPSTAAAKALRYVGRKFATAFPWLAVGGVGAGLAATGLLAPIVASMGGISTALSALSAEMAFSAGMAGTYAAPSIIQTIKDLFAADENSIQSGIKRWVEKYVGDDNDVQEFMLVHSKAAYEGKPGFRWRAKEWPVKMTREQAEAYLEKNDKSWLDYEKQKAADAEKAAKEQDKEGTTDMSNMQKTMNEGMPADNDMGSTVGGSKMTLGQWKQMWMKKMPTADFASLFRSPPSMPGSAIAYFDGWMNNPDARWDPQRDVSEDSSEMGSGKGDTYKVVMTDRYGKYGGTIYRNSEHYPLWVMLDEIIGFTRTMGQGGLAKFDFYINNKKVDWKKMVAQGLAEPEWKKAERDNEHDRLATGTNEEKQRLDPKCWDGYKKQGTKMKGDTRVNNCVPVKESAIMQGLKKV